MRRRSRRSKRSSKNTKRRRRSSKRQRGGVAGNNWGLRSALPQDARRRPYYIAENQSHSVKPHQTPSSLAMAPADGTRKRRSTMRQKGGQDRKNIQKAFAYARTDPLSEYKSSQYSSRSPMSHFDHTPNTTIEYAQYRPHAARSERWRKPLG